MPIGRTTGGYLCSGLVTNLYHENLGSIQGASGVAKDLAKMSSKSAVKLLAPAVSLCYGESTSTQGELKETPKR